MERPLWTVAYPLSRYGYCLSASRLLSIYLPRCSSSTRLMSRKSTSTSFILPSNGGNDGAASIQKTPPVPVDMLDSYWQSIPSDLQLDELCKKVSIVTLDLSPSTVNPPFTPRLHHVVFPLNSPPFKELRLPKVIVVRVTKKALWWRRAIAKTLLQAKNKFSILSQRVHS